MKPHRVKYGVFDITQRKSEAAVLILFPISFDKNFHNSEFIEKSRKEKTTLTNFSKYGENMGKKDERGKVFP